MSNAIAVAFERDDVRMVQKPVQHRGGFRRFVEVRWTPLSRHEIEFS